MAHTVSPGDVLHMPVGEAPLSQRLYQHAQQTGHEVAAIVRQHAQGLHDARALALRLYDGYNPKDGIRRPLEGAARAELPKALNPRHPVTDICDLHASADLYGLGKGCYPKSRAPRTPFHPHCWCVLVSRPDLDAQDAKERKDGVREYLRGLDPADAARVLGSRERLAAVMNGADWEAVTQAGIPKEYRLKRLGDVGHMQPNSRAVDFVEAAMARPREKQPPLVLVPVSDAAVQRGAALGIPIGGKLLALDHDGVRHILKSHGDADEAKRGQAPITTDDIARWDRIFNAAAFEVGDPPLAKDGTHLLAGSVPMDGWVYGFAAKVRERHVVPYTLYKRPQK